MHIAVFLVQCLVRRHGIKTQQIETDTIRNYILTVHHLLLLCGIAIFRLLVERIVLPQILIQTDADRIVTHNDTLIQRANLGIDLGYLYIGNVTLQEGESGGQSLIDVIHIGILLLGLCDQTLQNRVLIKTEELGIDLLIVYFSNPDHILNQRPRLHRVYCVHLL